MNIILLIAWLEGVLGIDWLSLLFWIAYTCSGTLFYLGWEYGKAKVSTKGE